MLRFLIEVSGFRVMFMRIILYGNIGLGFIDVKIELLFLNLFICVMELLINHAIVVVEVHELFFLQLIRKTDAITCSLRSLWLVFHYL